MKIAGKTVLITGASAGIGAEFARQFHSLGATVVLVARRRALLEAMAVEFNQTRAESAVVMVADIANRGAATQELTGLSHVIEYIKTNQIDILVNNAGRGSFGALEQLNYEVEQEIVDLNVAAPLALSHAVIPQLKERRSGAVITVASVAAFQPLPYMTTYAASKAFDFFFSMGLRYELARFGIRVLAVCPGPVATEFGGVARFPGTLTGIRRDTVQDVVRQSIRALHWNSPFVVPCFRSWMLSLVCRLLPTRVTTFFTERSLRKILALAEAEK